jgi:hypothetical protein
VKSKWCRPDTLWRSTDKKWYVEWCRPCHERWGSHDNIIIHDRIVEYNVEWHGMVDNRIVYHFWHCPPGGYPELVCVEFDEREGLERLLRAYEKDRPARVYCRGELPQELLAICGGDELRPST